MCFACLCQKTCFYWVVEVFSSSGAIFLVPNIHIRQFLEAITSMLIGHENAHARMSAFLAIISAIFTKLLQLKWSETGNCI